ncbi:MAG: tRNA-binding protein [Pelagibacteraceae bacterium]|nr:tRNA-binding protein [Rhodobiaceae bacterium]MBL6758249.1 tRNA-binding protein [Pelagibacteraceae bacterium]RPF95331.1 MAG: tRNA-binding protein [Rhizobiales bacterium TMED227]
MKKEIRYEDYDKIQIATGTILEASVNEKAKKPAYVLKIDFGNKIGVKTSSAQITNYYKTNELINKQVMAICNFPPRNIAGINSEVLILGAIEQDGKVVLFHPSQKVKNGLPIA